MKDRPRRPLSPRGADPEPGYPTLDQEGVTRRAFLGAAMTAGAAGGLDLVSMDLAEARGRLRGRPPMPRHRFRVSLPRQYRCPRSGVVVTGIHGHTSDRSLQKLLLARSERRAIVAIVLKALRAHRRERLSDPKVRRAVASVVRRNLKALVQRRHKGHAGFLVVTLTWHPPSTS